MIDQFGRSIEYLRISVTDRCNFRCVYCMPEHGLDWLPRADILSYEEIADVVAQLAPLGLKRLRITGGEPTIRPDLVTLIGMLKAVPGIEDIALSTNGVKLPDMSAALKAAGLDRVNMSADSLRADRIAAIAPGCSRAASAVAMPRSRTSAIAVSVSIASTAASAAYSPTEWPTT